jgi:hypothetical protein
MALLPHLDEHGRRSFAEWEAPSAGVRRDRSGGAGDRHADSSIGRALKELAVGSDVPADRVRCDGDGHKPLTAIQPDAAG